MDKALIRDFLKPIRFLYDEITSFVTNFERVLLKGKCANQRETFPKFLRSYLRMAVLSQCKKGSDSPKTCRTDPERTHTQQKRVLGK
jgi:hypothetical protein